MATISRQWYTENQRIATFTWTGSHLHLTHERGTLRTLIKSAYLICSNEKYLEEQLNHMKFVF